MELCGRARPARRRIVTVGPRRHPTRESTRALINEPRLASPFLNALGAKGAVTRARMPRPMLVYKNTTPVRCAKTHAEPSPTQPRREIVDQKVMLTKGQHRGPPA